MSANKKYSWKILLCVGVVCFLIGFFCGYYFAQNSTSGPINTLIIENGDMQIDTLVQDVPPEYDTVRIPESTWQPGEVITLNIHGRSTPLYVDPDMDVDDMDSPNNGSALGLQSGTTNIWEAISILPGLHQYFKIEASMPPGEIRMEVVQHSATGQNYWEVQ